MRTWSSTSIFHWLQGPKCKQTQLTEQFAPIKHSMRAFKEFTFSHKYSSFAPLIFVSLIHYCTFPASLSNFILFICTHAKLIYHNIFYVFIFTKIRRTITFIIWPEQTELLFSFPFWNRDVIWISVGLGPFPWFGAISPIVLLNSVVL